MKKLLFLSQNLSPFRAMWINELSNYYDITLYHLGEYHKSVNENYYSSIFFNRNIEIIDKKKSFFKWNFFDESIIKQIEYDFCLMDGYGYFGAICLLLRKKIPKKKLIMSIDGGFIPSVENNKKSDGFIAKKENFIKKIIKTIILNYPSVFLSTSNDTDELIRYYNKKNSISIIRHMFSSLLKKDIVDIDTQIELHNRFRNKFSINSNEMVIILVGRFLKLKNFEVLLKAFKFIKNNVKILLVGGIITDEYKIILESLGLMNSFKQYIKYDDIKDFKHKINFINFLSSDQLKELFFLSDIFCIPSKHDVWGLVVLEAIAFGGLPIISSDMCLAAKAVIKEGKNGNIVKDDNPITYAACIDNMIENLKIKDYYYKLKEYNISIINDYVVENATKNDVKELEKIFI